MTDAYREMLTYIKSAVTRNYSEKCINNIMDFVSGSASQNFDLLQDFYQTTLKALEDAKNEVNVLVISKTELSLIVYNSYLCEFFFFFLILLCRDCGSRQILSFARSFLTWVSMVE